MQFDSSRPQNLSTNRQQANNLLSPPRSQVDKSLSQNSGFQRTQNYNSALIASMELNNISSRNSNMNCVYDPRNCVPTHNDDQSPSVHNQQQNFLPSIDQQRPVELQQSRQDKMQPFWHSPPKKVLVNREYKAFFETVYSIKMQMLIVFLQLVLSMPIFEYNFHLAQNFHTFFKLKPWTFGLILTNGDEQEQYLDSYKILEVYDAIEIIKDDHKQGFPYNITYYESKPKVQNLLIQYLEIQHELRNKTELRLDVDFAKIKSDPDYIQPQPLNNTAMESQMLSNTTIKYVLEKDYTFIQLFKNDTTIIGLQYFQMILAQLLLVLSLITGCFFQRGKEEIICQCVPFISIFAFIMMHNTLVLKLEVQPFYDFAKEHIQSYFLILCLLQVRHKFHAFFILAFEFLFWRFFQYFSKLFPVENKEGRGWVYMTNLDQNEEQMSKIIFQGTLQKTVSYVNSIIAIILIFVAIVANLYQQKLIASKIHSEQIDLTLQRANNAQMIEIVEVVSKPLILFKKIETNRENKATKYSQMIGNLVSGSQKRQKFLTFSAAISGQQSLEFENKYFYEEMFASSDFKNIVSQAMNLRKTSLNQSTPFDQSSYEQSSIELQNSQDYQNMTQEGSDFKLFEFFSDLKFLESIVFKEILFKIDQNLNVSKATISDEQDSQSQESLHNLRERVDTVNGTHYTIKQLIESHIFDVGVNSSIYQLMFKQFPSEEQLSDQNTEQNDIENQNGNENQKSEQDSNLSQDNLSQPDIILPHNSQSLDSAESQCLNQIYVRVKIKEFVKFGSTYRSLQLSQCDLAKEVKKFSLNDINQENPLDIQNLDAEEENNDKQKTGDSSSKILDEKQSTGRQEQDQREKFVSSTNKNMMFQSNRSSSFFKRNQLGTMMINSMSSKQDSNNDWIKARWIKAADLVFRMIPEQQSMINSLINFTEGVIFNVINIKKTIRELKQQKHNTFKQNIKADCFKSQDYHQKAQLLQNLSESQSVSRDKLTGYQNRYLGQFETDIEETERYIKIIWQTAKILAQQVEVESLFMKLSKFQMDFHFQKLQEGSIRIFQEVLSTFKELIIDKQLSINVQDQTTQRHQILNYDWTLYKSMFYLQFQCAQADALSKRKIFIQSRILTQQNGCLVFPQDQTGNNVQKSDEDDTGLSDGSNNDRRASFLVTKIFCMSGIGNNLEAEKVRKIIRKQANFRMAKDFASLLLGNVSVNVVNKISIYQTVLPLSLESYELKMQKIKQPSGFSNCMAKPQFLKDLTQLTATELNSVDFFEQFDQMIVEDENFTKSQNSTQIDIVSNLDFNSVESENEQHNQRSKNVSIDSKLSEIKEESNQPLSQESRNLSNHLKPILSRSLSLHKLQQATQKQKSDLSETNSGVNDTYEMSISDTQFGGAGVDEGEDINEYVNYENINKTKSNYIKDIGVSKPENTSKNISSPKLESQKESEKLEQVENQQKLVKGQSRQAKNYLKDEKELEKLKDSLKDSSRELKEDLERIKASLLRSSENRSDEEVKEKDNLRQFVFLKEKLKKDYGKLIIQNQQFVPGKKKNKKQLKNQLSQIIVEEAPNSSSSREKSLSQNAPNRTNFVDQQSLVEKDQNQSSEISSSNQKTLKDKEEPLRLTLKSIQSLEQISDVHDAFSPINQLQDVHQSENINLDSKQKIETQKKHLFQSEENSLSSNTNSDNQSLFEVDNIQEEKFQGENLNIVSPTAKNFRSSKSDSKQNSALTIKSSNKDLENSFQTYGQNVNSEKTPTISTKCSCEASVLVVEDNFYNVVPLKMMLKQELGLKIQRAENGQIGVDMYKADALKSCCTKRFILIFMDIQMPVMNGHEATREILKAFEEISTSSNQSSNQLQKPVIFAMTAFANSQTISKCVNSRMNGILYKPINRRGLIQQIEKFFDLKSRQKGETKLQRK